ncbi:hypothetical protein [Persicimonas caeni]|uniref:hypothetical protein n=1 Tax=Persicimonas caeni TaxID=2292766 RepID=UPI00143DA13D|nr:hypothetical protein [Persicimonas caeni]
MSDLEKDASATESTREVLERLVEFVDRDPWLTLVEERFGISKTAFDAYFVVRPNKRGLNLVLRDHRPPERPEPQIIGMSFLRTRMRFPKLTTAAAMTFGPLATRNVVALEQSQADQFLSREPFELSAAQAQMCTDTGYVLVRIEDVFMGVGLYRAEKGTVQSLLPKAWTLADDESAFEN